MKRAIKYLILVLPLAVVLGCKYIPLFPKKVMSCSHLDDQGLKTIIKDNKDDKNYICQVIGTINDDESISIDPELSKTFWTFKDFQPTKRTIFYGANIGGVLSDVHLAIDMPKEQDSDRVRQIFVRLADEVLRKEVGVSLDEAIKNKILENKNFFKEQMKADNRFIYLTRNSRGMTNVPVEKSQYDYIHYELKISP